MFLVFILFITLYPGCRSIAQGKYGKVLGRNVYSPAHLEKTHPDLFWYGIHGVEVLYTIMGTGCKNVIRVNYKRY